MKPTLEELMGSFDWKEAMKYAQGWDFGSIERVIFQRDGDNDGPSWCLLVELRSGGYGILSASCDYTGWGCQEGGESAILESLETAKDRLADLGEPYDKVARGILRVSMNQEVKK